MEVKAEVNGAQPLPQRQQKNAGNQGNQNQNNMKKPNQEGGGGPAEKKPRFNNQGGQNQQNRGGFGNKGFQNRNRMNRNQSQNRGNMQNQDQQNQGQGNPADESQLEKKPDIGEAGNLEDNKQNFNQRNNQNRGNRGNQGNKQQGGQRGGQRNQNNRGDRQGGGGGGNKDFRNQDDFHVIQRLRNLSGPTYDLQPLETNEEVKFSGRNRLYVGNLTNDITEEELQQMFAPYGEIGEVFCNAEKNFTFLKVDYHANAERAKRALDGVTRKGRQLRVRFAPNATILRVKNLTPYVSNELLYRSFEVFGPLERAIVIADDRGKSTGEGIVEFVKKSSASACLRFCNDKCFFLTSSLRPCVVELFEPNDESDGLPEKSLNRKTQEFQQERSIGPRAAEMNSFEHEYGSKWKQLYEIYKTKLDALKFELKIEEEKLEAQMEFARFEHETEMLRQELSKRERDNERKKLEWEMREKQVEELRKRDEENQRHQTNEMQSRMMRQEEDMRLRQQENALFMQAQQLSSLLDQQDGFGGGNSGGGGNFDNFGGNNNPPFQFQGGNNSGGNMGGGNNNGPNAQDPFPFEFGGNQGGNQGNQRNNNGGNGNNPWERRRRF